MSIPLYELMVKDFALPINLSYYAGGIKEEEVASKCWAECQQLFNTKAFSGIESANSAWSLGKHYTTSQLTK